MALEVALRRLVINAARADGAVQADLRAFLGFPACSYPGRSAGIDPEVLRHLARIPQGINHAFQATYLQPLSLLEDLRVVMWMVLSGAAQKVSQPMPCIPCGQPMPCLPRL